MSSCIGSSVIELLQIIVPPLNSPTPAVATFPYSGGLRSFTGTVSFVEIAIILASPIIPLSSGALRALLLTVGIML